MGIKGVKVGDEFCPYGKRKKAVVTKIKNGMIDYELTVGQTQVTGSMSEELYREIQKRKQAIK